MLSCGAVLDVDVIEDPAAAVVALDPVRARLLAELAEPASAAALASRVGLARQKVNYHLRTLEAHGLVRAVDERRWGGGGRPGRPPGARAVAAGSPPARPGPPGGAPARPADRLSAGYLVALAA